MIESLKFDGKISEIMQFINDSEYAVVFENSTGSGNDFINTQMTSSGKNSPVFVKQILISRVHTDFLMLQLGDMQLKVLRLMEQVQLKVIVVEKGFLRLKNNLDL